MNQTKRDNVPGHVWPAFRSNENVILVITTDTIQTLHIPMTVIAVGQPFDDNKYYYGLMGYGPNPITFWWAREDQLKKT